MVDSNIKKREFLRARKCAAMGWYERNDVGAPPSETDLFVMEEGQEIGSHAWSLYPNGVEIRDTSESTGEAITEKSISNPSVRTLYEAKFVNSGFAARADILTRTTNGWHIHEVKAALEGTSKLPEYINDVAYTSMVASNCGLEIDHISLILLSRDFRPGMELRELFIEIDVTAEALATSQTMKTQAATIRSLLTEDSPPEADLCSECKECDFFSSVCIGRDISRSILELPRLPKKDIPDYVADGVRSILDLPDSFRGTDVQNRVRQAVLAEDEIVEDGILDALGATRWPAFYLDFETVRTAYPLLENVAPYEQVLTQYSLHKCSRPGEVVGHSEFLADHDRDCRRELAERLLKEIEEAGSIIVYYMAFERSRIRELADMFPDLSDEFHAIESRLFDLLPVIRNYYYHPEFGGSFSIKKVLPVIVPELSYDELDVGDGLLASARFAKLIQGRIPRHEVESNRKALLEYCKLDTLAMVKLHERLLEIGHQN